MGIKGLRIEGLRNWELRDWGLRDWELRNWGLRDWELGIGVTIELKGLNKFNLPKKFVNSWLT